MLTPFGAQRVNGAYRLLSQFVLAVEWPNVPVSAQVRSKSPTGHMRIAVNILGFYAGWFGAAWAAARGEALLATLICLAVVVVHVSLSQDRTRELRVAAAAVLIGFVAEALLLAGGLTRFTAHDPASFFPPSWILGLWAAFATLLNVSLSVLKPRLWLAAGLGFVGAPISYLAGEKLGAIALALPLPATLIAIGTVWALAMPMLLAFARRFDRV
jgi:hypothetical protein